MRLKGTCHYICATEVVQRALIIGVRCVIHAVVERVVVVGQLVSIEVHTESYPSCVVIRAYTNKCEDIARVDRTA